MREEKILSERQRTFARLVEKAIYANPFTRERHRANCELTNLSAARNADIVLQQAIARVEKMVRQLQAQGVDTLPAAGNDERRPLAHIFLFALFHRYLPRLDEHITRQSTTTKPLELASGPALFDDLARLGFSSEECSHYIALFFQMRRAFYFLQNSLTGKVPCMEALRASLWNTVFTHDIALYEQQLLGRLEDFSTLLLGETGTGKGLAAAAIGRSGYIPYDSRNNRFATSFSRAFLAINLCQFPDSLLESELFGHARGAFTGAVHDYQGLFARSSRHGSVFLDEIGEINEQVQVKLLRILQERTFTPVGSHVSGRFAGRVIAATNRNINDLIDQGTFREDFYFRISTVSITLPSLRRRIRENPDELGELVRLLTSRIVGTDQSNPLAEQVTEEIMKQDGLEYAWPGNVRELEQAVRGIILSGTWQPQKRGKKSAAIDQIAIQSRPPTMTELTAAYCQALLREHGTIQAVARLTGLDRRTVKKYINRSNI